MRLAGREPAPAPGGGRVKEEKEEKEHGHHDDVSAPGAVPGSGAGDSALGSGVRADRPQPRAVARGAPLAGALGCDHATAAQVGRCRAPEPAEIPLWVEYIAARFGLDPARVAAVAQQIAW